jgi:ribosomal protein L34E
MITGKMPALVTVLKRHSPGEEEPRCKVCGQPLPDWEPGKPLICADHNPNRQRPTREGAVLASASFEEWVQRTLWYLAAP